jgi:hypothetical protein
MAPSSQSVQSHATIVAHGFFRSFTNQTDRLGDSLQSGLAELWATNVFFTELFSYGILGDPAVKN